jgi:hypothetical protein
VELYEIDDKGKDVGRLKIEKFDVVRSEELSGRMFWFNPKLDVSVGLAGTASLIGTWTGAIGLSVAAYGKTRADISWRFLRISAGMTRAGLFLSGSPVQWNLARHLPLVDNLYLAPFAGYDFGYKSPLFGLSISAVL